MATTCKDEFQLSLSDEAQTTEVNLGSDVTVPCQLSSLINVADMDIRWFKGTDCVCLYMEEQMIAGVGYKGRVGLPIEMEKRKISLNLKDFRESDNGEYWCQVTSGGRTVEIRLSLKTQDGIKMLQSEKTTPEQKKMEKSVLMTVFTELKDTKQECKQKDAEIEELKAELLQTVEKQEKENTQQGNMHKPAKELETSELNQDISETKTTPLEKLQDIEEVKVFSHFNEKINALHQVHKTFIGILRNHIPNLREVDTLEENDITLIFCPVSQTETEVDAALKRFKSNTGFKLAVLVVLHPTTDPEKIVRDSCMYDSMTGLLTVDCLFNEDAGLLMCQKNSDAVDRVINWLIQQIFNKERKAGAEGCPPQVFTELKDTPECPEKAKQESEEKDAQIKPFKAGQLQTAGEPEKENTQQENMHKPAEELETSELNQYYPKAKTTPLEKLQNIEEVKIFTLFPGNANKLQKISDKFIGTLRDAEQIPNLREVDTLDESDVALIFCPVVSRIGTDIDAALKRYEDNTGSKMAVLVVLHHLFNPEKTVLDSSRFVKKTNILTVDCLFNEDVGLLMCQKNSDSTDKVVEWLIKGRKANAKVFHCQSAVQIKKSQVQGQEKSNKSKKDNSEFKSLPVKRQKREDDIPKTKGVKMFPLLAGNASNCDQKFIDILEKRIGSLKKVCTVDESDIILLFCPVVSRVGTDIDSALNKLKCLTDSGQTMNLKPTALVVLHHTFDPEKVIPDSRRCVKRTDILTVDCLFNEDTGLLKCQRNSDSIDKTVNWLIQQEKNQQTSRDNKQQMTPTSSHPVNYFVSVTGNAKEHYEHFIKVLQKDIHLNKVHTVQESDVILLFCPDITEYAKKTDKPIVLITLHHTVDPQSVLKMSGFEFRQKICPAECILIKGEGLLDCPINREEISAVLSFLKINK